LSDFLHSVSSDIVSNPQFRTDFDQLTASELSPRLGSRLSETQVRKLLESSAILSLSEDENHQKLAYKLAIYLLNQYKAEYASIPFVVQLVLTRLGNLPVIQHTIDIGDSDDYFGYFSANEDIVAKDSIENGASHNVATRFPEVLQKKTFNRLFVGKYQELTLTDFQSTILGLLQSHNDVAFSAPTSAGKSYIVLNYLADQFARTESLSVVYIVPTKALVAEIQRKFVETMAKLGLVKDCLVFTGASILNAEEVQNTPRKIFVLTQERLQELLANKLITFTIDLVVVDEAQQIANETRGIVTEDAIVELIQLNPSIQKIFVSPYVSNLDKYARIFGIDPDRFKTGLTRSSPVGQNILLVNFSKTKSEEGKYLIETSVLSPEIRSGEVSSRTRLSYSEKSTAVKSIWEKKVWVARNLINETDPTLIYCNTRDECRRICRKLSAELQRPAEQSPELKAATTFLREHVHPDYYLADYLAFRTGYHYGTMPQFVRSYVKQLFEDKRIVYLACTSTLLEGVNLPAKNLIVHRPRRGDQPMDRMSLRNLMGRAGRLQMDYYGKIYCIDINEWEPSENVLEDKPETIESSSVTTLTEHTKDLIQYLSNLSYEPESKRVRPMATSLLMKQILSPDTNFLSRFARLHPDITQETLETIRSLLVEQINRFSILDKTTYTKNRSFDPRFQEELYHELKNTRPHLLLPHPHSGDFYDTLARIFELVSKFLLRQTNRRHVYFTMLANQWIKEIPYKRILDDQIRHNLEDNLSEAARKSKINEIIEELNVSLEETIRYDYTRGLKCFSDITRQILSEEKSDQTFCEDLYQYLETGASSDRVRFLIGAGLPRTTAITIVEAWGRHLLPEWNRVGDTVLWLREHSSELKIILPEILYRDLEKLILER